MRDNPWSKLNGGPRYVLPSDANVVDHFNSKAQLQHRYDLSLLPEPFFGNPEAPVVLLALNPGIAGEEKSVHSDPSFRDRALKSLQHALSPYPFLHLQPERSTPGERWWQQRICRNLISEVGLQTLAQSLFCAQYFPYHSKAFSAATPRVESQKYTFFVVERALARGAEIVFMRSRRLWEAAIPALSRYHRLHVVRNPRNPALSPGNLGASYDALRKRLGAGA